LRERARQPACTLCQEVSRGLHGSAPVVLQRPFAGDDATKLDCEVDGPEGTGCLLRGRCAAARPLPTRADTPYAGGLFRIFCEVPSDYPFAPPKMKFVTRVWHPNVSSQTGAICLDILKDEWTPALTIKTALISIRALLAAPAPESPQDAVVAKQFLENNALFIKTAREWTLKHAGEEHAEVEVVDPRVTRLMEMGFTESDAKRAIAVHPTVEAAMEALLAES
jgi:ubiquitin-conjugating enzyme (huntingtin interacting protein 2)